MRKSNRSKPGRKRAARIRSRFHIDILERRLLLTGVNEQALLNAIDAALQPGAPTGLTAFNTQLQGSGELGLDLPVVGTGMANYNPGTALASLLSRLGSSYTSLSSLVTALENGSGIAVTSSSDLPNNIELNVQFSTTTSVNVPLNANYGVTFVDPGTLTMSAALSESLTLGAYWDANTSSAVFYVDADNASITVAGSVTSVNAQSGAQLGFLQVSGGISAASFSPTFTFSLNDQPPVDSAESAGRLTASQLNSVPLATLVTTQITQAAPATVTANISTSLAPAAHQIVFTWSNIESPTTVSSTLTTDPTLTQLNELQSVSPSTISAGLDEATEDLAAEATTTTLSPANPFYTDLPLLGESMNDLIHFTITSGGSDPYSIFQTYLTNYTDPISTTASASVNTFSDDQQLLALINGISGAHINSLSETSSGSQLLFNLNMGITVPETAAAFVGLNVSPQLNIANADFPNLTPTVAVTLNLTFGEDGSTGKFFVTASGTPAVSVNVTASGSMSGAFDLGTLGINVTGGTLQLSSTTSITLVDPQTDNPPTPGIITSNELMFGPQPIGPGGSDVMLAVPATEAMTGTASVNLPISVNTSSTGGNAFGLSPQTIAISWPNVSQPSTYTFNTSSLGEYLGFNNLTVAGLGNALTQVESTLNDLPNSYALGDGIPLIETNLGSDATLGTALQNDVSSFTDFQSLYSELVTALGSANVSLTAASNAVVLGIDMSQNFSGSIGWSVDHPVSGAEFTASGTVPVSGKYTADIPLGIVLTSTVTPANQFYLLGGADFGGNILADTGSLSGSATLGTASLTFSGGTLQIAATNSGGVIQPTTPAPFSLSLGTGSTQQISLSTLVAMPASYFGTVTFSSAAAVLTLPLSGLPAPGTNPQVSFAWSNAGQPSSLTVTPSNLGNISSTQGSDDAEFQTGVGTLSTELGTWKSSSAVATDLPWIDEEVDSVIPFIEDYQTVFTKIVNLSAANPTALDTDIKGLTGFPTGMSIAPASGDVPSSNDLEYTLNLSLTNDVINIPFAVGAGFDSLFSLYNTTVHVTTNVTANLSFGFDPGDGFYVVGSSGTSTPQIGITLADNAQQFSNKTAGIFGTLPMGVTGAVVNLNVAYALNLTAPGDNGSKISRTELSKGGVSVLSASLTATGANNLSLPFGLQLGGSTTTTAAYISGAGPGITSSFTANWDPTQAEPMEFGSGNSTNPSAGFGPIDFDLSEFINDLVGPYLRSIEQYNPIPQSLLDALNYQIPVIDQTPLELLAAYTGDSSISDISAMLQILSLVNDLPSTTEQLDLSSYLVGAPATGDAGATDGGASGSEADLESGIVTTLENYDITLPVLSDPHDALADALLGQDVTLIQFEPGNNGYISYTAGWNTPTIPVPIIDLGVLSINATFSGGVSATLFGNIDIGLTTRGLLGQEIGGGGPNLLDGFFIDDTQQYQMGLKVEAHISIGGELTVVGISVASITGSLGPEGTFGIHVNDVYYASGTNTPLGIADYDGNPPGDGKVYLDELEWISSRYGILCAVMPESSIGVQITISAEVLGIPFTIYSHDFVIANWDVPCVPTATTIAMISGNTITMNANALNAGGASTSSPNTISASVWLDNNGDALGMQLAENNQTLSYFQDFTFAQLAGVTTLVMNGTPGSDTFYFDPNLTEPNFVVGTTQTGSTVQIQYLQINTEAGKDTANFDNLTTKNSNLLGLTIMGGNGNDYFEGNYCPDYISLGSGSNFAYIGTAEGEVVESSGADTITGGDGNDTVIGGSGPASISLGNGNNVINEGPGTATIKLGNGQNLITSSSLAYNSGVTANGSSLAGAAAPDGVQAAFIQGNSSISQDVSNFVSGDTYTLNFSAAQALGNASSEDFEVLLDSTVVGTFTPTSTAYQTFTATVKPGGSATSHYITFRGLDTAGGQNAVLVDNVQFNNVTAPLPDGGFESPALPGNGYASDPSNSDWTFSGAAGISANDSVITSGNPVAPEGSQIAYIENQGSISQTASGFGLLAGQYQLTFDMAQSALSTASGEDFQVLINGNFVATINPTSTSYQSYTTPKFSLAGLGFTVEFKGLDSAGGNNTVLIDDVQFDSGSAPVIADSSFELPAIAADSLVANDVVPNPDLATQPLDGAAGTTGWLFIAGIGEDNITVGNGNNTIHGDIGGSIIQTGSGQDIIYASGTGTDSVTAGGGNDFISVNLDVSPTLQIPSGMFTPIAPTFTIDGGAGKTLLDVQANGSVILTGDELALGSLANPTISVAFTDIASVSLSGGGSTVSFDISRWTGAPVQINGGGGSATIVSTDDTNFTLSDGSLSRSDGTSFALAGIGLADLTGTGSDNSFTVTGWHGNATLDGDSGNDTLIDANLSAATLSNSLLQIGSQNLTLIEIDQAELTAILTGGANLNASAFTGNVALFGQGNGNTLTGGSGSDYIVGGTGTGNDLIGNGSTDNELIGGTGSSDSIQGGAGENLMVSSNGGGDTITTGSGQSHVYTPGNNNTINAQTGNAIVYVSSTGDTVNTGSSTTDQVLHPGAAGTVVSDFVAPSTTNLWEFPSLPAVQSATLPTGTASIGQWVEYGTSASAGGVSDSPVSGIDPSVIATGSGSTETQYVAWSDNRAGVYQIYVARDSSTGWAELAGSAQGGGISNGTADSLAPSIALDSAGYPVVAWTQTSNIYVAEYSPTANSGAGGWVALGTSLGSGGISKTNDAHDAQIVNTTAGPTVAWLDTTSGVANIFIRQYTGSTWAAVGSGSASGNGISNSAVAISQFSLATDGTNLAVAWPQAGTAAGTSVYAAQYNGSTWPGLHSSKTGDGISGSLSAIGATIAYSGGSLYVAYAANTDGTTNIVAAVNGSSSWNGVSVDTPASAGSNQVSRGAASDPVLSSNGSSLELVWIEDRLPTTPDQAVAIYANQFSGDQFVRQLPGDASFDGILGHSTSLSQPATLDAALDSAGHPFVVWGDSSSGTSQVYMLGDTLSVHQIIYVNDAVGPDDSYTTAPGAISNTGLTPNSPLGSIQAALNLATITSDDVILVDSGTYAGFTVAAADNGVLIIGSPDGTTDITGTVNVNSAQNITLQWMDFSAGASLSGDTNIELNDNIGGSVTESASSSITLDGDAFVGVALGGGSNITVINTSLAGTGLVLSGAVTGLSAANDRLQSLSINSASQGNVTNNNISGGGVAINAVFTGSIADNFIHGAPLGIADNAAAPLSNNQIFHNHTGVQVSSGASLGFVAGSSSNYIVDNPVGVKLLGSMQGQFISDSDTGVIGSGLLGGTSLADANQIDGNTIGVNFDGNIENNRIDYNGQSIVVQSGQLIADNLIYDNTGPNLDTNGASDVEIVNNSFYSPTQNNIQVDNGSSDVEILNNILWTGGGYDIAIDNASRTGYFSDYNDLYSTGSGQLIQYLGVSFDDILDWQDDVDLYDLHSIGTTVVNPTWAQPQFVDLGFGDFNVFPAAAGIRATSPTIATGDPESDLALPSSEFTNLLQNPSFESGTTGWTVNSGGTTQSGNPTAFDGASYFDSGAVASGFAQQTISLLSEGYTTSQIDSGTLDISFGGRIRSALESPVDQGQLVLTFLDASGDVIGTPTLISASNTTDRWELVGARVHVPVGARSVEYSFQSTRESGSTDDSYLDAAFLFVVANTIAPDIGGEGAGDSADENPADEKIQLQTPDLYVNWTLTQTHNIVWATFGNTSDVPVKIDLYQDVSGTLEFLLNITPSTSDTGSYAWIPQSSGLTYGTYDLRIKVSLVGDSAISDISTENFTIPENGNTYYINDGSRTGDQYTTAAGNNRATGKLASAPLPLLTTLLRTYPLGAENTVYVDTGTYYDFAPVELSANPSIGDGAGITIVGPTTSGDAATINALGFVSPAVIDVNDATFVTITDIGVVGANYGIWVHNASGNFVGSYLTATGNLLAGIRIESDSSSNAVLTGLVADNNTGDGVYVGGPFVSLTSSTSYDNTGDGFDLANAGAAVLTGDTAYGNSTGFSVTNSTSSTTTDVGNATLTLGLGNKAYNNSSNGIYANGSVLVAGNVAYGQSGTGDAGIDLVQGATATENIVYNNYDGILSATNASTISNNLAYDNANVGIEGDYGATLTGNVSDNNGIGIRSMSPPNVVPGPYLTNNLVHDNTVQGIWLTGGHNAQINNNTVYQLTGDALYIDAYYDNSASGIQVENNIFWTQNGVDISLDPTSEVGFRSDYNDLYYSVSGNAGNWEGVVEATFTDWQTASANDPDSISTKPIFVNPGVDFHEQSQNGSFHGGSLAPVLGGSGLPIAATAALTDDAFESPAIDRGDPTFSFSNEPSPNGGYINLGAYGDTAQASLSPTSYVLVLKPVAGQTLVESQNFTIVWRSQDMSGTVNIDLIQGSVTTPIVAGATNTGSYVWTVPTSITPGSYTIRVTRNPAPTAVGVSGSITIDAATTNYYVNGSSTAGIFTTAGGSDANSGLDPAHPKATIQDLLDSYQLGSGDTIFVDVGTYNLSSNIILTAANSGLTIEGVAGDGTILDRTNTDSGSYVLDLQTVANITLENFTITGGFYGINASYNSGSSTNLTIESSIFYGSYQAGLNLANDGSTNYVVTGDLITGNTFHDMLTPFVSDGILSSGDQATFTNNIAYNLTNGLNIQSADGSTISGNKTYDDGTGIAAVNATVTGNISYDNSEGIGFTSGTLSGNTTYNNTGDGISISGGTATGNISYGNSSGLVFNGNATASDNLIYNNSSVGISGGNGSLILGNVLYGNGIAISLIANPSAAQTGPTVENNVAYNNTTGGIYLGGGDTTPILNNTIYQSAGYGLEIVAFYGESTHGVAVRDNIIWNSAGPDASVDAGSEIGVSFDYNDLYVTVSGQIGSWGGTSYTTLAAWQGATGMDADSISANPLFVNVAGNDFHEQSLNGSYHGGTLAPILNTSTGLPQANPGTLTDDSNESPAIDRGDPIDSYANEPSPNGGYVNLGAYGDSSQASLSPAHYLFVTNPIAGQSAAAGQSLTLEWRDEISNTPAGASDTDTLELLTGNNSVVLTTSAPDTGSYVWALPGSLTSGTYYVEVIRNDSTHLTATSGTFTISAFNGIYYVNGSSTAGVFTTAGGNDANSGLNPASPKATIGAILSSYTLEPGNIIMVDQATYNLSTNLVLVAADSGITIEGVAGKTILNRGNTSSNAYDIDFQGATNVTLENLTLTGGYVGINASYGQVSTGLTVTNCIFTGDQVVGLDLQGNNGSAVVTDNQFESVLDGVSFGSDGLYSQDNTITATNNTAYGVVNGLNISGGLNASGTIENNTIYLCNNGINVSSQSEGTWVVANNTLYDNFDNNLTASGSDLSITGNTLYQDGGAGSHELTDEDGIDASNGPVVSNNIIYGNINGIDGSSATLSDNVIYDNSGDGINYDAPCTIQGNDIYSSGAWGIQYFEISDQLGVISNNLIYLNASGGIDIDNAYSTQVVNNTIYQTAGPAIEMDGFNSTNNGSFPPEVNLQNNILWATAGPDVQVADGMEEGFTSDYNDLYFSGTGYVAQMAGVNFATLTSWAWELGLDVHSISVNPQFVNPSGPDGILGYTGTIYGGVNHGADDNFHVQSTSPIIDAGNPSSEFISEPQPNGGRINVGYDGGTAQATTSSSAPIVQVTSPVASQKLQAGQPATIQWQSTGLLSTQTITEVATGESVAVGEYHPSEFSAFSTGMQSTTSSINTSLVTNPAPQAVYQTWADAASGVGNYLLYDIPVPNGAYTIRLDFADATSESVGQRVFDVLLQGQVVKSSFDIFATAGTYDKAVALTFSVTATGGTGITLQLKNDTYNPAILNGFEISQAVVGGAASQTVNLQVSTNNGGTWTTIATNQPIDAEGRGSYVWTPTAQTTGYTALVRVVANNAAGTTGVSGSFLIANAGTAFYVNDSSTTGDVYTTAVGNNANSGTSPSAPMASIEAVLNDYQLIPGDTIYVDNGTYTLFHNINIPVADSGIIIQGPTTAGATATLNRNATSSNDFVFYLVGGVDNITLSNLAITGAYYGINSPLVEGVSSYTTGVTVERDIIYSNTNSGINTGFTYNWTITGNVIHDNRTYGIYLQSGTATITNNTIYNHSNSGIDFSTPVNSSSTAIAANIVGGNTAYGNGVGINVSGVTVTGNLAHDNTSYGIEASNESVVTGNTVWRQTATNDIGINSNSSTVNGNFVFGNYNGIYASGSESIILYGNRVYSNTNYGMYISGANASPEYYVEEVYDNLVYANSTGGIFITGSPNLSVYNNTVYQLVGDAINVSSESSLTVENNILWVQAGYDLDIASNAQGSFVSNYNILYHVGTNANVGFWNSAAQATLAVWQSASAQDAHSSEANPLFVDPAGADATLGYNPTAQGGNGYNGGGDDNFFISAGSPAIGTGNHSAAPATDLLGYTVNNPPDIGAYAYRGTTSSPPTVLSTTPTPTQLAVVFSQTPNDIDAAASSLYQLRGAGPDGVFGTSDDVVYTVTASYQTGTNQVVLAINGGALPPGLYQLTILSSASGSVHNLAGVELDGDDNGTPGGNYVTTFTINSAPLNLSSSVEYLKLDADGVHIDVWNNSTATGLPAQSVVLADTSSVTYSGPAGGDLFILDFSAGDPLPASGLSFVGGSGQNTLKIIGTTGNDTAVVNASSITVNSVPISYSAASTIIFDGDAAGTDTLTQTAQPASGAALIFSRPTSSDSISINAGTFTIPANSAGSGITVYALSSLTIAAGASVAVAAPPTHSDRMVLSLGALYLAGSPGAWTGKLDLTGNDLILHGGNVSMLTSQIAAGYNGGRWNGSTGITSSSAAAANNTALGIELNSNGSGGTLVSSFDGQSIASGDVLVKYTYYGDANLDGVVNGSDYTLLDNGFNNRLTGWRNGDFNYDGVVNGDDYTLIDNAFNTQGASLAADPTEDTLTSVSPNASASKAATAKPAAIAVPTLWASDQPIVFDSDDPMKLKKRRNLFSDTFAELT